MSDFSVAESISRPTNLQCPVCDRIFKNAGVKKAHQRVEGHFQCAVCKAKFHDDAAVVHHVFEQHKTVHEIKCPGCLKTFIRAGAWLQHVESYECTGIFPEDLEARKKKTEDFKQALARLESSGPDWLEGVDVSTVTDTWRDDPILVTLEGHDNLKPHFGTTVDQNYTKPVDFPRLATHEFRAGDSKQPDLLTGDAPGLQPMQPANAWAQKKDLFRDAKPNKALSAVQTVLGNRPPQSSAFAGPAAYRQGPVPKQDRTARIQVVKSYNAVPPTPDLLGKAAPTTASFGERILDPDYPNFSATVFHDPILDQFKCPHRCNKKYRTARDLVAHLRSPAHKGVQAVCPSCRRKFMSNGALLQHMESAFTGCWARDSDQFRRKLSELSGGLLDIKPGTAEEDRANPEGMTRDMANIFLDEKAVAELRKPSSGKVPGLEETARQQADPRSRGR
ncbi:hypothetical protein DL764_003975 [Monosporascus ibericus]|uniref:C2H2-type domain-containing protein n=1 Tax=Monosporascus ibericus TaxID=155417 RepID=A0A4Q4TEJ1_9PEZI|nr:hypothetical protein DL764_003975 [Monosporascus ibericus]